MKNVQKLSKAVLASSLILSGQAFGFEITTDSTTPFELKPNLTDIINVQATNTNLFIKGPTGSLNVAGTNAVTVAQKANNPGAFNGTPPALGLLSVDDTGSALPEISSDNSAVFFSGNGVNPASFKGSYTFTFAKGSVIQATGSKAIIAETAALNSDVKLVINNSGTMQNLGTDINSNGIVLGAGQDTGFSLTNASTGVIKAGNLANFAINLTGMTTVADKISNAGTISAPSGTAIKATGGVVISTVTNSGNISGKNNVIDFTGSTIDVNLTGGSVVAESSSNNAINTEGLVNISGGSMVGRMVSTTGLNIVQINLPTGGVFSTGGNIVNFASVVVNTGTLSLGHSLTTAGGINLTNNGALRVTNPVNIVGSLLATNKNAIAFDLTSNTVFGSLTTGAGTDIGTANISITNSGNGLITNNTNFTVLTAPAMLVTGGEPTISVPTSAVYRYTATKTANNITVNVLRTPLNQVVRSDAAPIVMGVANALETMISGNPQPTGLLLQAIGELGRMQNAFQVEEGLLQLMPYTNDVLTQVILNLKNAKNNYSYVHVDSDSRRVSLDDTTGYNAGSNEVSRVWVKTFTNHSRQSDRKRVFGYSSNDLGITLGVDTLVTPSVRLGLAATYDAADVKTKRGSNIDVDTYQFSAYGVKSVGCGWFDAMVSYGRLSIDGKRRITVGAVNALATNNHHGSSWNANLGYGHLFMSDNGLQVVPTVGTSWSHVVENPYEERGADTLNLKVQSHSVNVIDLNADVKASTSLDLTFGTLEPSAHFGVNVAAYNPPEKVNATFMNTAPTFRTVGFRSERVMLTGGIGLFHKFDTGLMVVGHYDLSRKHYFVNHAGSLTFKYNF